MASGSDHGWPGTGLGFIASPEVEGCPRLWHGRRAPGVRLGAPGRVEQDARMGVARVWTRGSATLVVLGLLATLGSGTWWLTAPGTWLATGITALVGLCAAGYGLAVRPRATDPHVLSTAAAKLADAVAHREATVLRRLLADRVGSGRP